jgi:hypothetical protein
LNLDTLKEQKIDPKIGAILLETWQILRKIVLYSDYCGHTVEDLDIYYERHKVGGRKDPAGVVKEGKDKKPSHNVIDLIGFMKGL